MSDFSQKVIARSGLSLLFAERTIARACERAGLSLAELSSANLRQALPEIERAIAVYLGPASDKAMHELSELCDPQS